MGQYAGNASTSEWLNAIKKDMTKVIDKELADIETRCAIFLPIMGEVKEIQQALIDGHTIVARDDATSLLRKLEESVRGK